MARIVLTIISELFDVPNQEASIRENLPARTVLAEARKEFNLPEDGVYSLRVQSTGKILDPDKTLEQQSVQTGAVLLLNRERRAAIREVAVQAGASRITLGGAARPFLREDTTGKNFDITFQPAIIGRPDPTNPRSVELLAVNLGPLDASKSVSRYHARISEENNQYFLESLADHNPAYLNGSIVRVGEKRLLKPGDKVRTGKISLTFGVRGQTVHNAPLQNQSTMIGDQN